MSESGSGSMQYGTTMDPTIPVSRPRPPRRRRRWIWILILLLIGFGLAGQLLSGGSALEIQPGSTLHVTISGRYVESASPSLISRALGDRTRPFLDLLSTLSLAETDPRITTVILDIRMIDMGWGKLDELRQQIELLEAAGKKTIAYLELEGAGFNRPYYLATAADEIYAVPGAALPFVGLSADYLFLGGVWEKLGVEIDTAKAGKYKSAVEAFAGTGMSKPSREMANSLLDALNHNFIQAIANGRDLETDRVRALIDEGPVLAQQLADRGLIDGVMHFDAIPESANPIVTGKQYLSADHESAGFEPEIQLAIVYGTGTVVSGDASRSVGGDAVFSSGRTSKAILDAAKDPEVDGIIFRIDSGGGSAMASEVIWSAMNSARTHGKPIVASFSDVAASGAYYVASAADGIVAPSGSLTGSIGVFVMRPSIGGLLSKFGINFESIKRGRYADFNSFMQPYSDASRERLQSVTLDIYALFVDRVAEGRGMELEAVDAVAQGRVWTGSQAFERGLVDEIGGLDTAVKRVLRTLGRDEDTHVLLIPYPAPASFAEEVAQLIQGGSARNDGLEAWIGAATHQAAPLTGSLAVLHSWLVDLPLGSPLLIPSFLVEVR